MGAELQPEWDADSVANAVERAVTAARGEPWGAVMDTVPTPASGIDPHTLEFLPSHVPGAVLWPRVAGGNQQPQGGEGVGRMLAPNLSPEGVRCGLHGSECGRES